MIGFSHPPESRARGACRGSIPSSPRRWLALPDPYPCHSGAEGWWGTPMHEWSHRLVLESSGVFPCRCVCRRGNVALAVSGAAPSLPLPRGQRSACTTGFLYGVTA